ncbi:MAG: carboxyl transferase domain-containing protein [Candidatus Nanopelagicales bacterium]
MTERSPEGAAVPEPGAPQPGTADPGPLRRLAIVNRGVAAMRLVNAAREHGTERGTPLTTIVLHTDDERDSLWVREADEAVSVGPGTVLDPASGRRVAAYHDLGRLEVALRRAAPDAVWVGWGPLARQPEVAELCERLGIRVLGPPATALRRLADPAELASLCEVLDIVPAGELDGGPEGLRQVDVVVMADGRGGAWAVGTHDGTVQRRTEKLLTETPVSWLDEDLARRLRRDAVCLLLAVGWVGAGTVSYHVRPATGDAGLVHVSAGLPLGHPVTELCSPLDLAKLQLRIAEGLALDGEPPTERGHAIAVRLVAEDPWHGFEPAPGQVLLLRPPTGPGLRIDTGITEGDTVIPDLDPTVAEVAAWGATREEARARLHRALAQLPVVVAGGITSKGFLLELLDRPEVRDDTTDLAWLSSLVEADSLVGHRYGDIALLVAAVDAYDEDLALELTRFHAAARRGRPSARRDVGHDLELVHQGIAVSLHVDRTGPDAYRITAGDADVDLVVERGAPYQSRVTIGGRRYRVVSAVQGGEHLVEVDGVPHRLTRDDYGVVATRVPGVIVDLPVRPGQEVAVNDPVAVVESMKMETAIRTPVAGRVRELLVGLNVQVDAGTPVVRIDPPYRDVDAVPVSAPVEIGAAAAEQTPLQRCDRSLEVLRLLVLGYDVDASGGGRATETLAQLCAERAVDDSHVLEGELHLLTAYADLRALFRSQREPDEADVMVRSPQEHLYAFLRAPEAGTRGLPQRFVANLRRALSHYGIADLTPGPRLDEALYWIYQSQQRTSAQTAAVVGILQRWLGRTSELGDEAAGAARATLDRLVSATSRSNPVVADLAREVRFRLVDEPVLAESRRRTLADAEAALAALVDEPDGPQREELVQSLVACPQPLAPLLLRRMRSVPPEERAAALEVMTRRYHRGHDLEAVRAEAVDGVEVLDAEVDEPEGAVRVLSASGPLAQVTDVVRAVQGRMAQQPPSGRYQVDLYLWTDADHPDLDDLSRLLPATLAPLVGRGVEHVVVALGGRGDSHGISAVDHLTFRPSDDGALLEDRFLRGLHPMMAERLSLWRLAEFDLERLPSPEDVYLFRGVARDNPKDERLFAVAEVRDLTPTLDAAGRVAGLPQLDRAVTEAFEGLRRAQASTPPMKRPLWNRVLLYVWPPVDLPLEDLERLARRMVRASIGLGLEEVLVQYQRRDPDTGALRPRALRLSAPAGGGFVLEEREPPSHPLVPLDEYTRKVVQSRRRGAVYPYELLTMVVSPRAGGRPEVLGGGFVEYDLDESGERLVPVDRPPGRNTAGIIAGVVTNTTSRYPEGMSRVALLGDPTRALGSLAEAECRRILAALDLAEEMGVPLEWYAISAGARIAMDSGTENMDWIADVLRRIIEFTQDGYEVNVVVTGINVGAQPYWNAEATMLMHTKGILVMTPDSAMVLTGKQALDFSGSVSAEDNHGIGGYERVMGPNGQAQYWAPDLTAAIGVLLAHYDHAYVAPGERFPRRAETSDPVDRDIRSREHTLPGSPLRTVGDVLSDEANPGRKAPFEIRSVMRAVIDSDHAPLERWREMADADTVVVWDAHLGGIPVCLIGIEAHAIPRTGALPADGPEQWTSGTLFPMSSKKTARAVNAASGNRPLVVLANLSGFDGSPESMRRTQLEFGAEIGRAVVNFDGPIVFCVVSRYHGGAFVVFSQKLNPMLETLAVEGSHASVLGGAPAAAVVFAGEVRKRVQADPRIVEMQERIAAAEGSERARLRAELSHLTEQVHGQMLGDVAAEFDEVHSVERAQEVGSVSRIIPAVDLRPALIEAVERGMSRTEGAD